MNVQAKMKNLENKYIDLANFYKESIVRDSGTSAATAETGKARSAVGNDNMLREQLQQSSDAVIVGRASAT